MMIAQTNQRQRTAFQDTQPREIEPGDLMRHYPKGLDYQGRYPEAGHAASEYTDDEPPRAPFDTACVMVWIFGVSIGGLAMWAAVSAFLLALKS